MGTYTLSFDKCPKCGQETECYDHPSSNSYYNTCNTCDWEEDLDYYEDCDDGGEFTYVLHLLSKKEARELNLYNDCPNCGQFMDKQDFIKKGICIMCQQPDNVI